MAKLKQDERLLLSGHFTPMQFIERNCHSADGLIQRVIGEEIDEDEPIEQDPDDDIIEDEDIIRRVNPDLPYCLICELVCEDKFVFICGCMQFCNNCSSNILAEENPKCPQCEIDVTIRINLH